MTLCRPPTSWVRWNCPFSDGRVYQVCCQKLVTFLLAICVIQNKHPDIITQLGIYIYIIYYSFWLNARPWLLEWVQILWTFWFIPVMWMCLLYCGLVSVTVIRSVGCPLWPSSFALNFLAFIKICHPELQRKVYIAKHEFVLPVMCSQMCKVIPNKGVIAKNSTIVEHAFQVFTFSLLLILLHLETQYHAPKDCWCC